ncbi:MAG: acetolactate synthase large subunit [Acetobacteraceae bacterium]
MNGAESLVHTLLAAGVDTCFANPGTSEMHFVAALDRIPGMRCVLGLQENVVTGMADGYFRIARKPAATLLHCGPGLANGLSNLHNARRARSGIVNCVGDQATWHRPFDAPLTADTEGWAKGASHWVRTCRTAAEVGAAAAVAAAEAASAPGRIATLILPSDTCWDEGGVVAAPLPPAPPSPPDPHAVKEAARALRRPEGVLLLLGGQALTEAAQKVAQRIVAATGVAAKAEMSNAFVARGQGRMALERVPYPMAQAIEALAPFHTLVCVASRLPVGFFGYPGGPSLHSAPGAQEVVLCRPEQDVLAALEALADELGAPPAAIPPRGPRPEPARGAPTPEGLARTVAALIPEGAIVADESVSFGRGFYAESHDAPPHDWIHLTGGAIGAGMPLAAGAAIGAGGQRRVVNLQADGSAMYTVQALWTEARERLPVTTVILSNRAYAILLNEYRAVGANPGRTALDMMDLGNPDLDWVRIAEGMGVPAARTATLEGCADLLRQSFSEAGPFLIELVV